MIVFFGTPLPPAYHPSDFAILESLSEKRGACDSLISAPSSWIAQAKIEVFAESNYLRRQAYYDALLAAVDLADSD